MNKICRPLFREINVFLFKDTKRFAGHSKWKNIKHIKEKNDAENSVLIHKCLRHMRAVIAEKGSPFPDQNMELAHLINEAKKKHVPHSTINAFLAKMQKTKNVSQNVWINVQGPEGCMLVLHILSDNVAQTHNTVNSMLKKHKCRAVETAVDSVFNIEGVILTEKFCDIDAATDLAIEIGAEDVSEFEKDGKTYLKFTCNPIHLMVVKHNLEKKGHTVSAADDEYTPYSLVELSDESVEKISKLIDTLSASTELVQFYDNIA